MEIAAEVQKTSKEMEKLQEDRRRKSFRDMVLGSSKDEAMEEAQEGTSHDDGEISDDDAIEGDDDGPCIKLGMTKEAKKVAREPWKYSVIIKVVVGRRVA